MPICRLLEPLAVRARPSSIAGILHPDNQLRAMTHWRTYGIGQLALLSTFGEDVYLRVRLNSSTCRLCKVFSCSRCGAHEARFTARWLQLVVYCYVTSVPP
ncbi:hypothetical protein BDZ89DRAFT_599045 [Hymenopellis radicata]|nr:hypothetical protein BDZ89DRAFT_599045 [Hymenopellis radicata]